MKTKEEIIIWGSDKDFSDSTSLMIKGYLLANGIEGLDFYSANRFKECSFEEFVEWFNEKTSSEHDFTEILERFLNDWSSIDQHREWILEPYHPKEGEFFVAKIDNTFISYCNSINKKEHRIINKYWTCIDCPRDINLTHKDGWFKMDDKCRPATEEEKQQLIREVEKNFRVTYCEKKKDWIEIDKEVVHNSNTDAFEKELGELINRYSLESFFGNKPDYQIAREMVEHSTKIGEIGGYNNRIKQIEDASEIIIKRGKNGGHHIIVGDYIADSLSWDEMLGTLAAITLESDIKKRKCINWLMTKEEHIKSGSLSLELKKDWGVLTEEEKEIYQQYYK